jgi:hypothetical protein
MGFLFNLFYFMDVYKVFIDFYNYLHFKFIDYQILLIDFENFHLL